MQYARGVMSWRDRWYAVRDRLLSHPGFQAAAARAWITRPIARRRAAALFDLCAGFVYSQVLYCCVRLDVFAHLSSGPKPRSELALRYGMSEAAAGTLFDAAIALKLLEARSGGRVGLGVLGAALRGNPGVLAMIEHHALFYADLGDPLALLRAGDAASGTRAQAGTPSAADGAAANHGSDDAPDGRAGPTHLSRYWPYAKRTDPARLAGAEVSAYTALMSASQPMVASQILAAYRLTGHQCLLDVGGGDGTFIQAAAARTSRLRFILFDLPAVAERARLRFAQAGLAMRAAAVGGDFLSDELPRGADVATLIRVIHDHDDAGALTILKAVRRALQPGGVLLLAEPMAAMQGAESVGDAYFGFYLLAMGRGRPRRASELKDLVRSAGFESVQMVPTDLPLQTALLTAHAGSDGSA